MNNQMDKEVYEKVLLMNDEYKDLSFVDDHLVYGKYLHVMPPITGKNNQTLKNKFSMQYNQLYNEKYNIDPYADSCSSSDDESLDTELANEKVEHLNELVNAIINRCI